MARNICVDEALSNLTKKSPLGIKVGLRIVVKPDLFFRVLFAALLLLLCCGCCFPVVGLLGFFVLLIASLFLGLFLRFLPHWGLLVCVCIFFCLIFLLLKYTLQNSPSVLFPNIVCTRYVSQENNFMAFCCQIY